MEDSGEEMQWVLGEAEVNRRVGEDGESPRVEPSPSMSTRSSMSSKGKVSGVLAPIEDDWRDVLGRFLLRKRIFSSLLGCILLCDVAMFILGPVIGPPAVIAIGLVFAVPLLWHCCLIWKDSD